MADKKLNLKGWRFDDEMKDVIEFVQDQRGESFTDVCIHLWLKEAKRIKESIERADGSEAL